MAWHQDGASNRDLRLNRLLGLYYPADVTPEMGPTVIVPATQYRNAPTWNHDPEAMSAATDWNRRDEARDPKNILTFGNPLGVSQSDHYKERVIRGHVWDYLTGRTAPRTTGG